MSLFDSLTLEHDHDSLPILSAARLAVIRIDDHPNVTGISQAIGEYLHLQRSQVRQEEARMRGMDYGEIDRAVYVDHLSIGSRRMAEHSKRVETPLQMAD